MSEINAILTLNLCVGGGGGGVTPGMRWMRFLNKWNRRGYPFFRPIGKGVKLFVFKSS